MKNLLTISFLLTSTFLAAEVSKPGPIPVPRPEARHGIYLGLEGSHEKSKTYDSLVGLKTGDSMPGIHVGYLYEQNEGICWHVNGHGKWGKASNSGKRSSAHLSAEVKYRFPNEMFTFAPIFGLKSQAFTLEKTNNVLSQQAQAFIGVEFMKQFSPDVSAALEIRGHNVFSHHTVVKKGDNTTFGELKDFYGIDIDVPVRINVGDDNSHQLELRPYYRHETVRTGHDAYGMQTHLIHWF